MRICISATPSGEMYESSSQKQGTRPGPLGTSLIYYLEGKKGRKRKQAHPIQEDSVLFKWTVRQPVLNMKQNNRCVFFCKRHATKITFLQSKGIKPHHADVININLDKALIFYLKYLIDSFVFFSCK